MDKYIEELVSEMHFDISDLAFGHTYKDIGYESKKEFFEEMARKLCELESRLGMYKETENA